MLFEVAGSSKRRYYTQQSVYGSLAIKSTEEVEMHVINNLRGRVVTFFGSEDVRNLTTIKIFLHALGNTGSKLSIPLIMKILNSTSGEDYNKVKLIPIDAFVKLTESPVVLVELGRILEQDSSADTVAAIIETLHDELAYVQQRNRDIEYYIYMMSPHALVYSLTRAVSSINSTDLYAMMEQYLQEIEADGAIFELLYGPVQNRSKRNTYDWDSSANSDYNYVNTLVNRQSDVNMYSRHTAYITSKTIGIDDANIKLAYGYFAGASTYCNRFKAIWLGLTEGYIRFDLFIYIGYLTLRADLDIHFDLDVN